MLVVFLNNGRFIFLVLCCHEFLGSEEVDDVVIIRLLHRLVDLQIRQVLVAGNVNLAYFRFLFLIHSHQYFHVPGMILIGTLNDMHFGIVIAFLSKVFLDHRLAVVFEVWRHLRALANTCFYLHVLFLAFLESFVLHGADARTLLQSNDKPNLIAFNLFCLDLHIGEQTLFPETLDGFCDLVARYFYLIAHSQSGETDQHEVFVTIRSLHFNAGNLVSLTRHAVLDLLCKETDAE